VLKYLGFTVTSRHYRNRSDNNLSTVQAAPQSMDKLPELEFQPFFFFFGEEVPTVNCRLLNWRTGSLASIYIARDLQVSQATHEQHPVLSDGRTPEREVSNSY